MHWKRRLRAGCGVLLGANFALYRVMWIYNHDNALMYEERMRDYAAEDDAENKVSMSFQKWRRRCRSASQDAETRIS